jgi:hypothetical protein
MDPALAQKVLDAKAQAERNRTRINHFSLCGLAVGLVIAVLWFLIDPSGSPEPQDKIMIGVMIGIMLPQIVIMYRPSRYISPAKCPCCGYDWEIREGRHVPITEHMPSWDKCPGCGAMMSEPALILVIRRQAKRSTGSLPER